jgi:hypothetical protein
MQSPTYTVHLGKWVQDQANAHRNGVTHIELSQTLGLADSSIFNRYKNADWAINDLFLILNRLGATLDEVLLPNARPPIVRKQDGYSSSGVSEPGTAYDAQDSSAIKLERDLLRERLADKDALIAALQAQLAR